MATVVCRDVEHLYSFVTARVGALTGVQSMEVTPVLRQVKQSGAMTDGHRLTRSAGAEGATSRGAGR